MYKNYTIKFYGDRYDYHNTRNNNNKYFLLTVADAAERVTVSKFIKCNSCHELAIIKNFINYDRQLTIFYILHNSNKYIDDMQGDLQKIIIDFYNWLVNGGLKK